MFWGDYTRNILLKQSVSFMSVLLNLLVPIWLCSYESFVDFVGAIWLRSYDSFVDFVGAIWLRSYDSFVDFVGFVFICSSLIHLEMMGHCQWQGLF